MGSLFEPTEQNGSSGYLAFFFREVGFGASVHVEERWAFAFACDCEEADGSLRIPTLARMWRGSTCRLNTVISHPLRSLLMKCNRSIILSSLDPVATEKPRNS